MQKSSDMVHHHLLQLISRSISVGCYPCDLPHSATRGATVVFFHVGLPRSGSRIVLRISYRHGQPKSHLALNDAASVRIDSNLNTMVSAERNQHLGTGFQSALRK
jgi:hypothetical protein